ncbi:MAG TPA: Fic family protein [Pyrinomonadaceae bacterium]|jgi:Fic family protein
MNALEKAERLKAELDSLRPLDSEAEARIMQKFRLDWNYHSNNLEGNSLTYGETKALILFGITAQGKPLKDHFEITGHNEAINWILEIVKGETVLTEAFIRQLHTLLLKESSYKEARTTDGNPTRRLIEVGKYKTQPNHVITVTGETFYFATPEETPAKMHDLVEWFRKEKENADVNPIILAARFHYRFIRIHPFDDGNGRVARILMNFILMQFGYPPAIIKTEDKENYYAVLRLADADELEPFIEYIGENLVRSLEIMIRGAKGESIEEPDDLDKELALLEGKIKNKDKLIKCCKSKDILREIFKSSVKPFFIKYFESCKKFNRFYLKTEFKFSLNGWWVDYETLEEVLSEIENKINDETWSIGLKYDYFGFNLQGKHLQNHTANIAVYFDLISYVVREVLGDVVSNNSSKKFLEKTYPKCFTETEIKMMVDLEANKHKKLIQQLVDE